MEYKLKNEDDHSSHLVLKEIFLTADSCLVSTKMFSLIMSLCITSHLSLLHFTLSLWLPLDKCWSFLICLPQLLPFLFFTFLTFCATSWAYSSVLFFVSLTEPSLPMSIWMFNSSVEGLFFFYFNNKLLQHLKLIFMYVIYSYFPLSILVILF